MGKIKCLGSMGIFIYLLYFLACAPAASANGAVIASSMMMINSANAAAASNNEVPAAQGCVPPMAFAAEHNCALRLRCNTCIQEYMCVGPEVKEDQKMYEVVGDCKGNVVSAKDVTQEYADMWKGFLKFFMFALVLFAICITLVWLYWYLRLKKWYPGIKKRPGGHTKWRMVKTQRP